MAKIVELSGCNGVGKSTLYKHLEISWSQNNIWIPSHYLFPKRKLSYFSFKSFFVSIGKKLIYQQSNFDDGPLNEAAERFLLQYPNFIDAFWELLALNYRRSYNRLDLRFESISFLYTIMSRFQFLSEEKSNRIAIMDEGLIHQIGRIVYPSPVEVKIQSEIEGLLEFLPLPDGLIHLYSDIPENAKRVQNRGHIASMHRNLTYSEIELVTIQSHKRRLLISKILESKGVPILKIESSDSLQNNANKIILFCEGLNAKSKL
jgi:hypothetical protein